MPKPCSTAGPGQRVVDVDPGRRGGGQRRRNRRDREAREHHAERAAGKAQRDDLRHVDGQQLTRPAAEALQDGDAAELLLHEHARDARHANAAEDHDDEADQTEIVFGAFEVFADIVFGRLVRADAREPLPKSRSARSSVDQPIERRIRHLDQPLVRRAAAERQQARSSASAS